MIHSFIRDRSILRRRKLKTEVSLRKYIKCFLSTLRRRNLKTEFSLWKHTKYFRPHYAGEIWNRNIGFVFEENSSSETQGYLLFHLDRWIISETFHDVQNANRRCTGHATMSTESANDRLITVHAPFLAIAPFQNATLQFVLWQCQDDCCRLCGFGFWRRKENEISFGNSQVYLRQRSE